MSRIGNAPVPIPPGVSVDISGGVVKVSGPKGELSQDVPAVLSLSQEGEDVVVSRIDDERESRSLHGMFRSLINNMVIGVSEGFTKELDIVGVGYRAAVKGSNALDLQLGYSHPVEVVAPEGIEFVVPLPTRIEVRGIDKQMVGQVAADIRALRKPEPYKGKGVRYVDERVRRKAGKAGK